MKIDKLELIKALKAVQPGLAGTELIKQSTHFCFSKGAVTTYNDEISVRHPVPGEIKGAVLADVLLKILDKMKADKEGNIFLEQTDTELLITNGRKAKAGVTFQMEVELPLEELDFTGIWHQIPKNFKEAVRFCLFSTSDDSSFPIARCLNIAGDWISSTDNARVTRYKLDLPIKAPFLILNVAARHLLNFEVLKFMVTEEWVHFKTPEGAIFSSRTMQESFPDIAPLFDVGGETIKFPKKMKEISERANIFSAQNGKEGNNFITVAFTQGQVTIKGEATTGWFEESAKVSYAGADITMMISPEFLLDILGELTTCTINEEKTHIKFASEKWGHVIGLM